MQVALAFCRIASELANVLNDCSGQSVYRQQYIMLILVPLRLAHGHLMEPVRLLEQALVGSPNETDYVQCCLSRE